MGWNSANEIFDPVAEKVVAEVAGKWMTHQAAVSILETLAANLMSEDWDTWDESQERFSGDVVVVSALENAARRWSE